jgi:pimeloyl-ACP methyl ester carboxylesterase
MSFPRPSDASTGADGSADLDPSRFATHWFDGRGFRQAYVHEGVGGVPVLLVHGWPESKRLYWRTIEPLAAAGFEVICPDLRAFGESEVGPDGFHDTVANSLDLAALVGHLGHERVVLVGGDFGGAVIQDFATRFPERTERMVIFNSPLPYVKGQMDGLTTRSNGAHDYFLRQATDADALAAELATPEQRRRYIATFYSSRFWAHPGAFDDASIAFHAEPFGDPKIRATWGCYEASFDPAKQTERPMIAQNPDVRTLILYGPSDHVVGPDYDRMAAVVFPDHVGPYLVRDCGHFVPWEAPSVLVSSITSFCSDLLATPPH